MKHFFTVEKFKELKKKLKFLIDKKTPELRATLDNMRSTTFAEDDTQLSDVMTEKTSVDREIKNLEHLLKHSKVIGKAKHKMVELGSSVKLKIDSKIDTYLVVDPIEADPLKKKISLDSEMGKLISGKKSKDIVEYTDGEGIHHKVTILAVK